MPSPLATILMPARNAGATIGEAIHSLITQRFKDWQLLVVDDGSEDDTREVILNNKDKRVRLIALGRQAGFAHALNAGLKEVKSPFLFRMDADDIALPDRLKAQFRFLWLHPSVDISGSHLEVFGAETGVWRYPLKHNTITAEMLFANPLPHPALVIRLKRLSVADLQYRDAFQPFEDYDLWMRLLPKARFANINKVLLHYRRSPASLSGAAHLREVAFAFFAYHLPQLGFSPTTEELNLHVDLYNPALTVQPAPPEVYQRWLNKIIAHTVTIPFISNKVLEVVCQKKLQAITSL